MIGVIIEEERESARDTDGVVVESRTEKGRLPVEADGNDIDDRAGLEQPDYFGGQAEARPDPRPVQHLLAPNGFNPRIRASSRG